MLHNDGCKNRKQDEHWHQICSQPPACSYLTWKFLQIGFLNMRSAFNFLAFSFTSFKLIFFSFSLEIKKKNKINALIPKECCIELQHSKAPAAL